MIYIEDNLTFNTQEDQKNIARDLLLKGLKYEYGIKEMPKWGKKEHGKPYFIDFPEIKFNISHCSKAVVCALDNIKVGIDVECIHEFDPELAGYICNKEELEEILQSDNPALSFTILWTKKESYAKMTGIGINSRKEILNLIKDIEVNFNTLINSTRGYVLTSCTKYVK